MKILTGTEMKALEERALADGATAEALMNEAGRSIGQAVQSLASGPGKCVVHFGKGHNGGDALVAAAWLSDEGWEIELRPAFPRSEWSELTAQKRDEIKIEVPEQMGNAWRMMQSARDSHGSATPLVVLDGLLGIGAGGPLRGPIRDAARAINQLRATQPARVFALDLPTGVDADTGAVDPDAVLADYTLTIGYPKAGLLSDAATRHVGRLAVVNLDDLTLDDEDYPGREMVATPETLRRLLPLRNFETHKGQCGRVGIVAGSRGMLGAAHLAADACLFSGAGLVTVFVTEDIYPLVAPCMSAEIMVQPVKSYLEVLDARLDVLAIGPGLGQSRASEIRQLIERAPQPTVVDADALNILAGHLHLLDRAAGPRLLTPHPGEMARLDPLSTSRSRRATVEAFTERWPHTLLLKGARTLVGQRDHPLSYNTTGTPGMATGGMGDVLTGVCAALVGQGLALYDAARFGAWLCGHAAELGIQPLEAEEALIPSAVTDHLGAALHDLRCNCW